MNRNYFEITFLDHLQKLSQNDSDWIDIEDVNCDQEISLNARHIQNILRKNKLLEKTYELSQKRCNKFYRELRSARKRITKLEEELKAAKQEVWTKKFNNSIASIFHEGQIQLLSKTYKKIPRWCNETLVNAFKLRFAGGTSGYNEILRQKLPFPSVRTLTRKLENLKFTAGTAISEVFHFLKIKVDHFTNEIFKDCIIILDEMSITPGNFYDTSSNTFIGNVTLEGHDQTQTATHALVIMLAGLGARWKQVVRYELTGDSVNGALLKPVIDEIILKAEEIGLRVRAVTSDMGPVNQATWKAYGINASRYSTIKNSCIHPLNHAKQLFFARTRLTHLKMQEQVS